MIHFISEYGIHHTTRNSSPSGWLPRLTLLISIGAFRPRRRRHHRWRSILGRYPSLLEVPGVQAGPEVQDCHRLQVHRRDQELPSGPRVLGVHRIRAGQEDRVDLVGLALLILLALRE